jgi:diaminohydroxyphosphoribosylaminopyrimidine deaminase/5-amino-6-(5-phosphoribosylamino)uracil reductase
MKAAMSLDGKITSAGGFSKWITGEPARRMVHRLRSEVGAVMVGIETVLADDPQLTNRIARHPVKQPLKVVIDSKLRLPLTAKLVTETPAELIVICTAEAPHQEEAGLVQRGVRVIRQPQTGRVDLSAALESLGGIGVQSVLAEGGSGIYTSLVTAGLVNEYYLFYAPFLVGGVTATGVVGGPGVERLEDAPRLVIDSVKKVGADLLVHAYKEDLETCLPV